VIALRASARVFPPATVRDGVIDRKSAFGPTVLCEPDCTVWVPDGWRADVDASGAWVLRR
jgi:hypothetical protein